jgi:hypothetical protein
VARLATTLVTQYLCILTGEDRYLPLDELLKRVESGDTYVLSPAIRSDGSESEKRRALMTRLLCTLYYLAVFFRVDGQHSPLRVAMVKWKAFGATFPRTSPLSDPSQGHFAIKVRTLLQRKLSVPNSSAIFAEQDIRFLVSELTSETNPTMVQGANNNIMSTPQPVPQSSASGAVQSVTPYFSLVASRAVAVAALDYENTPVDAACVGLLTAFVARHAATILDNRSAVLAAVLNRLRGTNSETTFVMLTCLLQRQLLYTPFTDVSQLEEALTSVLPYQIWPEPFATTAIGILRKLSMEFKCPGVTWRHQLERSFPNLREQPVTGKELEAIVFGPPDSAIAVALESFVVQPPTERAVLIVALIALYRATGLLDESDGDVEKSADVPMPFATQLGVLSVKKLRSLYKKTRTALDHTLQIASPTEASTYISQRMEHLRR